MDKLKEQFKKLTGETDEELVSSFLLKSQNTVLSKTNRSELIDDLNDYVLKLAIALYNRQGNEGLASYSERLNVIKVKMKFFQVFPIIAYQLWQGD